MNEKKKIKIVFCDVDGTLTDGTVFYSERGEEFKQFSHKDGRAFHLLREVTNGKTKVFILTSEVGGINAARAAKFQRLGTITGYVSVPGPANNFKNKSEAVKFICAVECINVSDALFIGDDTNDSEALSLCGHKACPADAHYMVQQIKDIKISNYLGGRGAVRDIVEQYLQCGSFYGQEEINDEPGEAHRP
jgi:YrbI family 3-deoxy-D-manno-octulosonate 8-phosphate phosphatase